jgi:monoamine oxidase
MAKTPLFALLRRCLSAAGRSLKTGRSAAEIVEERRAGRLSRRRFLEASAAVAGAAATAGCLSAQPAGPVAADGAPKVLVVGAGIAGLTAAWRLRQAKVPVQVIEGSDRVGGRMYSLRGRFADNQVCELGGELLDTGHEVIMGLAKELGIEIDDLKDGEDAAPFFFFAGERRTEAQCVEAVKPLYKAVKADIAPFLDKDGEWKDITHEQPNGAEKLDRLSLAEWFDKAGAAGWIRKLLEIAFVTEYGLEADKQSCLNLLTMIDIEAEGLNLFGESDERFHVRGGNDRIVRALGERLSAEIRTGTKLLGVAKRADGMLVCTVSSGGAAKELAAAHVVLALPFTMLREVKLDESLALPAVKKKAIAELGMGTNAKLMVGFTERVWRTKHKASGETVVDLPYQLSWETSRKQKGAAGIITNFTGGDHGVAIGKGTPAEQAAAFVAGFDKVFPGVAAAYAKTEALFHWPSQPWVKGSYSCYLPGQWTGLRGAEGASVGNLHFAGEHCSLDWQGFMEGGCETGQAAAREILKAMGLLKE